MTARPDEIQPPQPPPLLQWMRENLFSTWYNAVLTLASLAVIYLAVSALAKWVIFADWRPVTQNFLLFMVGQYPRDQLWRIGASIVILSALLGSSWAIWGATLRTFGITLASMYVLVAILPFKSVTPAMRGFMLANPVLIYLTYWLAKRFHWSSRPLLIGWIISAVMIWFLLRGLGIGGFLPPVPIGNWGGLLVTVLLAVAGILLSFPIGVLLALARRSSLPVLSLFSTVFIELIRGVPLISILFLFSLIVPLFLPPDVRFDRLLRALVAMTVFSAAYMAENVRGGLQSIPSGQIQAARAVGLSNFHTTMLIVLPQALRKVIPVIVGQFITLFKDTTLASGVAVLEILSIARSVLQGNPEYLRLQAEVYVFIAAIFWIFSYSMSVASRRIETQLGVGQR
ncbi:MAG: amino acid ABC transporter permease [Anaerolineales bacterium]